MFQSALDINRIPCSGAVHSHKEKLVSEDLEPSEMESRLMNSHCGLVLHELRYPTSQTSCQWMYISPIAKAGCNKCESAGEQTSGQIILNTGSPCFVF